MPDIRRGSLRNVQTSVFFRAVCDVCGDGPDHDGAEYQGTPEEAVAVAVDDGWTFDGDGLLRCDGCTSDYAKRTP